MKLLDYLKHSAGQDESTSFLSQSIVTNLGILLLKHQEDQLHALGNVVFGHPDITFSNYTL